MYKWFYICLLVSLVAFTATAQVSFVASWDFNGNTAGSSNNPNISASSLGVNGVTIAGYPSNAVSLQFWPTGGLSTSDYCEFSVTPQNYRANITSVTFDCNRSATGPVELAIRSNQDNFSSNIGTASLGTNFGNASFSVSFNGLENEVKFRIYAYAAPNSAGTIRLDNLKVNGTVIVVPLPVELAYFRGQTFDNQVQLTWETTWERDASHFDIQRSSDLKEFVTLQTLPATGNTRDRSRYIFADLFPLPGPNYYRLRQTDIDGKYEYSKIISVNFEDDSPQILVFGNPTFTQDFKVRLHKVNPAELLLFTINSQSLPLSFQQISTNDYLLQTNAPSGWYWIVGQYQNQRISQKVLLLKP